MDDDEYLPVFFAHCDCYCWPMAGWSGTGRCGACGVLPENSCDCTPYPTKAHKLKEDQ